MGNYEVVFVSTEGNKFGPFYPTANGALEAIELTATNLPLDFNGRAMARSQYSGIVVKIDIQKV